MRYASLGSCYHFVYLYPCRIKPTLQIIIALLVIFCLQYFLQRIKANACLLWLQDKFTLTCLEGFAF